MKRTDYAYSVAYVRAIENKLLRKTDIENLITAKSPKDAVLALADKGYTIEGVSPEDFEQMLSARLSACWDEIREVVPDSESLNILLYKNDFHNLKVAVKGVQIGLKEYENYFLSPHTVDTALLIKAAVAADFSLLPPMLATVASEGYEVLAKTEDSQLLDIIVDKASMDYTLQKALESKNEFIIGLITLTNTLSDIKTAIRCSATQKNADFMEQALSNQPNLNREKLIKAALSGVDAVLEFLSQSGYGEAAEALKTSIAEYEKLADNQITEYMSKTKFITLGIEPIVAYIHSVQTEIQSVRIIMSAKINGFEEEQIRSRLREFA